MFLKMTLSKTSSVREFLPPSLSQIHPQIITCPSPHVDILPHTFNQLLPFQLSSCPLLIHHPHRLFMVQLLGSDRLLPFQQASSVWHPIATFNTGHLLCWLTACRSQYIQSPANPPHSNRDATPPCDNAGHDLANGQNNDQQDDSRRDPYYTTDNDEEWHDASSEDQDGKNHEGGHQQGNHHTSDEMSKEAVDRHLSSRDLPIALFDRVSNQIGDIDHKVVAQEAIDRCDTVMNRQ